MKLSIILPVYNEEESLGKLYSELKSELSKLALSYEVIAVDDGSKDGTRAVLEKLAKEDKAFKVICLSKNYGQTAALSAGLDAAQGEILIPMDADLQNDPADIPRFLEKLDQGYDVVAGWRKDRQDNWLRRLPSLLANKLISWITGVRLHDYGCTMKAYRREVIKDVRFYGEMHRFMPVYTAWHGARTTELVVHHRARKYGVSKYGISRTTRVILDLLTVKFLMTYLSKPMHFFGRAGLYSFFLSFISAVSAIVMKYQGLHFNRNPLTLLTIFLLMMGVQFILMGLLAEILIRIYHEPRGRSTYTVRSRVNLDNVAN